MKRAPGELLGPLPVHDHEIQSGPLDDPLESFAEAMFTPRGLGLERRTQGPVGIGGTGISILMSTMAVPGAEPDSNR